jgi:hypothetical protein
MTARSHTRSARKARRKEHVAKLKMLQPNAKASSRAKKSHNTNHQTNTMKAGKDNGFE